MAGDNSKLLIGVSKIKFENRFMILSAADARAAEQEARRQRLSFAHLLRGDESKCTSARDQMAVRRIIAAAQERSVTYDTLLSEHGTQRLFDCGALWFARPG
jgi:hypothetical protein